jgi:hypothetical protein
MRVLLSAETAHLFGDRFVLCASSERATALATKRSSDLPSTGDPVAARLSGKGLAGRSP